MAYGTVRDTSHVKSNNYVIKKISVIWLKGLVRNRPRKWFNLASKTDNQLFGEKKLKVGIGLIIARYKAPLKEVWC